MLQMAVALVVLTILYVRMIKREPPAPVGPVQAVTPVLVGILSAPLSFLLFFGIAKGLTAVGFNTTQWPLLARSLLAAVLLAGVPEEVTKLLLMLLTLRLLRGKLKNVYEYILVGAAIGFGFTLLEEVVYGSDSPADAIGRLVIVAAHMVFGMLMAKYLGLARLHKEAGQSTGADYAKAVLIPMAIHILYDAFTADNKLMESKNDTTLAIGIALSVLVIVALFILQIIVLRNYKRDTEQYCAMTFAGMAQTPVLQDEKKPVRVKVRKVKKPVPPQSQTEDNGS